jgi:hypothetical protein
MMLSQLSLTKIAGGKTSRKMRPNPARRTTRMYSSSAMRRIRLTLLAAFGYCSAQPSSAAC